VPLELQQKKKNPKQGTRKGFKTATANRPKKEEKEARELYKFLQVGF
jgi:protein tyrosine phosphatase (PTP) superfamily phosphohydrolase (DUF442 family)